MNKGNYIGLAVMVIASVAVIALADPAYSAINDVRVQSAAGGMETTVATGEADGFGGAITAEVTMAGDKIVAVSFTGEGETPEIGGAAMGTLKAAIEEKQSLEGVDAVSGATITSEGVFAAVKNAIGQ